MSVVLQSHGMHVEVLDSGALVITDIATGVEWGSKTPGWVTLSDGRITEKIPLPGLAIIEKKDGGAKICFGSLKSLAFGEVSFSMTVDLSLSDDHLDVQISGLQTSLNLVSVEYPAHICKIHSGVEEGYLVVPFKQGVIIPSRLDAGFMRFMHNTWRAISDIDRMLPFESGALNMPWFGAVLGKSCFFAYVATPADCLLHVIGNNVVNEEGLVVDARQGQNPGERVSSLSPVWIPSHGSLSYPRQLRIELISGGYVDLAKRYLGYSKNSGRYVSLREKIEQNPLVERIIGAPDIKIYVYTNRLNNPYLRAWSEPILDGYSRVHTTFDQVTEMALDFKRFGMDRGLFLLGGWIRAGYDREHVDIWPPADLAGGEIGLSRASRIIAEEGYLISLHDNYQDFYPDAPSYDERFLMKDEQGFTRLGGVWDGGLCRLICSSQAFELAERNLDLIQKSTSINSYYLDTTTSAKLWECYDKIHPITRSEDRENKYRLLKFLADRGLVVGGEAGTDWAIPVCAFFEGLPGSAVGFYGGIESMDFGIATPLFNLVYHDAIVCYWQHGQPFGREDHINHVLHDLMSGQPSSWSLVYEQWADLIPLIRQCYELLANFHRRTAHYPMLSHEFLTPDFAVQRTRFGDGSEVIVNFGISSFGFDRIRIPPKGFILRAPGETVKIGGISRSIVYQ